MNPEVKADWVAALRSGEYEQGTMALNKKGKYCCLGVLCELAVKAGVVSRRERPLNPGLFGYGKEQNADMPPVEVWEWAGLEPCEANVRLGQRHYEVSFANDVVKLSFAELANLIEDQF